MNLRSSLPIIFITVASLSLSSMLCASEDINTENALLNTDLEKLTLSEQLIGKFLTELKNLPDILKYSTLAAVTSTVAALSTYNIHLKNVDMKTKTKKPTRSLTEKIDLQNISDHAKYLFYKTMSYLAYQNEAGEWKGIIPKLDNGIISLSTFFQELKKRIDPIICVTAIYLIMKHGITVDRIKMWSDAAKD